MSDRQQAQSFSPIFSYPITVQVTDLNYGNHVGNDRMLSFFHIARVQWLAHHQLSELDVGGCGVIMASVAINYLNQARLHQSLEIALGVGKVGKARFSLLYHCYDKITKVSIAKGVTLLSCFDYDTQKPVRMPPTLLALLTAKRTTTSPPRSKARL